MKIEEQSNLKEAAAEFHNATKERKEREKKQPGLRYSVPMITIAKRPPDNRKDLAKHIVEAVQKFHGVTSRKRVSRLNLKDWFDDVLDEIEWEYGVEPEE